MNIDKVKSFIVMDILEEAKEMERYSLEVIHLEIGEPDFPTPKIVREKLPEFLNKYKLGYTPSLGLLSLRESISKFYYDRYRTEVSPENIVIVPGSSTGIYLMINLLLDQPGDFITLDPSYPCYPNFIFSSGGNTIRVNVYKEKGFKPEISDIKSLLTHNTKGIIYASPSNPTGVIMKKETQEIVNLGIPVIVDEIYQGIVFKENKYETSVIEYFSKDGNLIISNGFSKYFSMPGWRIGWLVVPDRYINTLQRMLQNIVISTNTISQIAAEIAINEAIDELDRNVEEYRKRLNFAKNIIEKFGMKIGYEIEGAFYIYLDVSNYSTDSFELCKRFLKDYLVAITPGIDFGLNKTNQFVRFSLTNTLPNIELGLERFINMLYGYMPNPRPV